MGQGRSAKEQRLQQHIERAFQELKEENLGLALKWMLKSSNSVKNPAEFVDASWRIDETDFWNDAGVIDLRYTITTYHNQLKIIDEEVKRLAESYRVRQQAGLVLILHSVLPSDPLTDVGFHVKTMEYDDLFIDEKVGLIMPSTRQIEKLEKRNPYVERKVKEILNENPALVVSPLFERTEPLPEAPYDLVFEAEGVLIYQKMKEKAQQRGIKYPPFIGIGKTNEEREHWALHNIPHPKDDFTKSLIEAVKGTLNISYQPISDKKLLI